MKTPELLPAPIIVIDDDPDDLALMCEAFKEISSPHPVLCFDRPHKALEYLQLAGSTAHFTISDVHMQIMDAYTLRARMLEKEVPVNERPFYVISSLITNREIEYFDELRIHRYFIKAFRYEDLVVNARNAIGCSSRPGLIQNVPPGLLYKYNLYFL